MATTNASAFLEGLETSLQSLPAPLLSLMQLNSQSVVSVLSENIGESVDTLSLQLSENVLKPLVKDTKILNVLKTKLWKIL